ncbi:MAG: methyltransferase domain-containing protein [Gemmatimonadales bacterium]|nr:methyltransferase domain-containing protein [Gemmatimonadales bacterium]
MSRRLRRLIRPAWLGTLRRTVPLSVHWGNDRGTAIDRHYIEQFLSAHREDVRGRVLEVKNPDYIDRFGSRVEHADVVDIDSTNPLATVVADLSAADGIPAEQYDCFICTQTLQLIYDTKAAIAHAHRILRPGGVLLATVPSVSQIVHGPGLKYDYWRFTEPSCRALFGDVFGHDRITVRTHGNVLTCVAFLAGMAQEELSAAELAVEDPYFPMLVTVRAVKAGGPVARG